MKIARWIGPLLLLGTELAVAGMDIAVEEYRLIGSGVTPGGSAVWFAVEWTQSDWYPNIEQVLEIRSDTSGNGDVELVRSDPVSSRSVWFVVDTATGGLVGETPAGDEYRVASMPEVELSNTPDCTVAIVESHELIQVLLVRPTEQTGEELGVWQGEVSDGAPSDRDGLANGVIQVCLSDLVPVEGAGATPSHAAAGDTFVVIDSETFECRATHVESGF